MRCAVAALLALTPLAFAVPAQALGSNWYFSGSSDRRWDDESLNQLKRIPGSAFEVVRSAARARLC